MQRRLQLAWNDARENVLRETKALGGLDWGSARTRTRTRFCVSAVLLAAAVLLGSTGCVTGGPRGNDVVLFNGQDLYGWRDCRSSERREWQIAGAVAVDPSASEQLVITPGTGLLVNGAKGHAGDICTTEDFGDVQAHIEFLVPLHSNSGVYFMGRYEVQILDSYGHTDLHYEDCGGVYARVHNGQTYDGHPPMYNASKPPGEWQVYDIVFRAPRFDANGKRIQNAEFVSVRLNGVLIQQHVVLSGPTAGPIDEREVSRGPLRLQGDHGPVAYRNMWVRPLHLP